MLADTWHAGAAQQNAALQGLIVVDLPRSVIKAVRVYPKKGTGSRLRAGRRRWTCDCGRIACTLQWRVLGGVWGKFGGSKCTQSTGPYLPRSTASSYPALSLGCSRSLACPLQNPLKGGMPAMTLRPAHTRVHGNGVVKVCAYPSPHSFLSRQSAPQGGT